MGEGRGYCTLAHMVGAAQPTLAAAMLHTSMAAGRTLLLHMCCSSSSVMRRSSKSAALRMGVVCMNCSRQSAPL